MAATRQPAAASRATAKEPTPPDAPVTTARPSAGARPWRSSASTQNMAVSPAVPTAMARAGVSPSAASPATRSRAAPFAQSRRNALRPRPQPVPTTTSPAAKSGWFERVTRPARSTPGIIGKRRTTGALAGYRQPVLVVDRRMGDVEVDVAVHQVAFVHVDVAGVIRIFAPINSDRPETRHDHPPF